MLNGYEKDIKKKKMERRERGKEKKAPNISWVRWSAAVHAVSLWSVAGGSMARDRIQEFKKCLDGNLRHMLWLLGMVLFRARKWTLMIFVGFLQPRTVCDSGVRGFSWHIVEVISPEGGGSHCLAPTGRIACAPVWQIPHSQLFLCASVRNVLKSNVEVTGRH